MKMFTEEEAKKKHCPHVRDFVWCEGAKCMGWVQVQKRIICDEDETNMAKMKKLASERGQEVERTYPRKGEKVSTFGALVLPDQGYCGCNNYAKLDKEAGVVRLRSE